MNHVVPPWIERLLGINTETGEGTVWSIDTAWFLPPWVTLLVVALLVVVCGDHLLAGRCRASRRYRILLAALRLAILGLLLLMIAQVTLSLKRTGLPYAAVLIDDSLSMTIVDRYPDKTRKMMAERLRGSGFGAAELSRWNLLRTLTAEHDGALLRGIAAGHKLRVYFVTGTRVGGSQDVPDIIEELRSSVPKGETTRLGAGVRAALDDLRAPRRPPSSC